MDYCMNALKKTALDIRKMLLIAALSILVDFFVFKTPISLLLVRMIIAFPIALAIVFMIHLLLCYYGNKNDEQVGRNEKH